MHIPFGRDEIASFLEIVPQKIDLPWRRGFLIKLPHCNHRPVASLSYSKIYDLLEYALGHTDLPDRILARHTLPCQNPNLP